MDESFAIVRRHIANLCATDLVSSLWIWYSTCMVITLCAFLVFAPTVIFLFSYEGFVLALLSLLPCPAVVLLWLMETRGVPSSIASNTTAVTGVGVSKRAFLTAFSSAFFGIFILMIPMMIIKLAYTTFAEVTLGEESYIKTVYMVLCRSATAAGCEEVYKAILAFAFIWLPECDNPRACVMLAMSTGLGMATMENMVFTIQRGSAFVATLRGFTSVPLHSLTAATIGVGLARCRLREDDEESAGPLAIPRYTVELLRDLILALAKLLFVPFACHFVADMVFLGFGSIGLRDKAGFTAAMICIALVYVCGTLYFRKQYCLLKSEWKGPYVQVTTIDETESLATL